MFIPTRMIERVVGVWPNLGDRNFQNNLLVITNQFSQGFVICYIRIFNCSVGLLQQNLMFSQNGLVIELEFAVPKKI
jgi:hypothetical protein